MAEICNILRNTVNKNYKKQIKILTMNECEKISKFNGEI